MAADDQKPQRQHKDFKIGERIIVQDTNKRMQLDVKGQLAIVVELPGNGWVCAKLLNSNGPPLRIQQRYLAHAPVAGDRPVALPAKGGAQIAQATHESPTDAVLPARPLKVRITGDARAHSSAPGTKPDVGGGATPAVRADPTAAATHAQPTAQQPNTPAASPALMREVLRKLRTDMMEAEAHVPWNAVRSSWRHKRAKWRQGTKASDTVQDLAQRLSELRAALVTDSAAFPGCGAMWQTALDACLSGTGSHATLLGVWEELRQSIGAWLDARSRPSGQQSAALQASAARAVAALQRAAASGTDALAQVPVEAIMNNSIDGLQVVRTMLEKERKLTANKLNELSSSGNGAGADDAPFSPRTLETLAGGVPASDDFDSGAETDVHDGSAATDMNGDSD